MTLPTGMYAATPGKPETAGRGNKAKLLSDEKVKVLLANTFTSLPALSAVDASFLANPVPFL